MPRVLLVDDNQDAAEALAVLLAQRGHAVDYVTTPETALDAAKRFRPEVVFLDIGMPVLDGWQLARALKGDPLTREARLFALSAFDAPEDLRRSRDAGIERHLVKPVPLDVLLGLLASPR